MAGRPSRNHDAWHKLARGAFGGFVRSLAGTDGALPTGMVCSLTARTTLAACAFFGLLVAGGGCSSSSSSCVDFTTTSADLACTLASDCTFIGALKVCPHDPSCGDEIPVNVAAAARYEEATSGVPRMQVTCGAPSPVGCVNSQCAIVSPGDGG